MTNPTSSLTFDTFGGLLKYLRRRAQLTQRELAIAVGYTEGHVSRLEKNLRPPDLATVAALFIPALGLEEEPETAAQLMKLAASAHGDQKHAGEELRISRVQETTEISQNAESIPSNLPIQLTTFIGRQTEIAEITALLTGANPTRLVTLTGPGGMGKTRLALQTSMRLSHHYPDGIWFVDLAPLSSPELIPPTIASALSVAETATQSIEEILIAYLREKQLLIVIDNCEHLIRATAQIAEKILRTCARLQLLATSRELLNIPGEVNFRVPSLSFPEDLESANQTRIGHEAVQLFIERARNIQPSFALTEANAPIIAHICKQLDGMPLAIELAAARTSFLSLSQIEARLNERFQLLSGGHTTLPRHQTLRATIEWSHDLLKEAEKLLFRRLSAFAGGWTFDSANFVCADATNDLLELLAGLVNKSLVVVERQPNDEVRYRMLETIREFAGEQLRAANEMERLRARHFDYFLQMAQQGEPRLFAPESSIDWAEREIDNIRAALVWALEATTDRNSPKERTERALELFAHVWPLWLNRGYWLEGNEWLNQLLSVHTAPTPARARALLIAGDFARYRGDHTGAAVTYREALHLARELGDKKRIAWALMEMGETERDLHRYPEAISFLIESVGLFQELNDNLWVCRTSFELAETYMANGNMEAAQTSWEEGLKLRRPENDKFHIAWGLEGLGHLERLKGHFEQAKELYTESLKLKVEVMDKVGILYSFEAFAQLATSQNQFRRAAVLWGAAEGQRKNLHLIVDPLQQASSASPIVTTRSQLSEDVFTAAWAEGRKMKMQEAINYALSLPERWHEPCEGMS
jgi:predicted ATPase/transcriptional regulator with XRE-family HTH domain